MKQRKINGLIEFISGDEALRAIEEVGGIADSNDIDWAICGGVAMALYGSPRMTKDADVIAAQILPRLEADRPLGFGGRRYYINIGNKKIAVDWIVRDDDVKKFYQAALADAAVIDDIPVITPEWLVITKYLAGRFKDQEDAVFLKKDSRRN
jgi:hypothetical protein